MTEPETPTKYLKELRGGEWFAKNESDLINPHLKNTSTLSKKQKRQQQQQKTNKKTIVVLRGKFVPLIQKLWDQCFYIHYSRLTKV